MNHNIFSYDSMGTKWKISVLEEISEENAVLLEKQIGDFLETFDNTYSRFIKTSLVWKISENPGEYEVPTDFVKMLRTYFDFFILTDGKVNPLVGFTISDMGYDADYGLKIKDIIRPTPNLMQVVEIIDDTHILVKTKILFDFGALGKGYAVDKICLIIKNYGINKFLVDGSGDIYYQGEEDIQVGLEDPNDTSKVIGVISMSSGAMCASGINRRAWKDYHHIIDPSLKLPTEGILATWVIAGNSAIADALATALFFTSPEAFKSYEFEYCILNSERKVKKSLGFNAVLY